MATEAEMKMARETDEALERIARALWIANRNRDDLWDDDPGDGHRLYMAGAKAEYRERATRFLAALRSNSHLKDNDNAG